MDALRVFENYAEFQDTTVSLAHDKTKEHQPLGNTPSERLATLKKRKQNLFSIEDDILARSLAVSIGLVPEAYRNAKFSTDKIRQNIIGKSDKLRTKVNEQNDVICNYLNFNQYASLLEGILRQIKLGEQLTQSYIIGAPNGFGKTSFANEAIVEMNRQGWRCVPYVSLSTLSEIYCKKEEEMLRPHLRLNRLKDEYDKMFVNKVGIEEYLEYLKLHPDFKYNKRPIDILGAFSWSEYINADLLICFLTSLSTKVIESLTLKQVLAERGSRGKTTIVMTDGSLEPYKKDRVIGESIWMEILDTRETNTGPCYDRLRHISTFRKNSLG